MNAAAWPPLAPTERSVTAGVGRRSRRVRVERRDRRRAVQRVPVGGAVVLDRAADDPGSRAARWCRPAGSRSTSVVAASVEPEQAGELLVGPHRDQVAAAVDPAAQRRHLRRVQRACPRARTTSNPLRERRRENETSIVVKASRPSLRRISPRYEAERVRRRRHDEHRRRRCLRGERPADVRRERISDVVRHAARAALDRRGVCRAVLQRTLRRQASRRSSTRCSDTRGDDGVRCVLQLERRTRDRARTSSAR